MLIKLIIIGVSVDENRQMTREVLHVVLKIVGNETQGESGRRQILGNGLGPWGLRII